MSSKYQYEFIHVDLAGHLWRHVHFSRIAAEKARRWWATLKVVKACSSKIAEQPRNVASPRIIGRNVDSIIFITED